MIDDLLVSKLISKEEYDIYMIFQMSESGRNWYQRIMKDTFLEQPPAHYFSGEFFAFADGRRSIIRDIIFTIDKINLLIQHKEST